MANSKDVVVTGVSTGIGWGTTKVLVSKGFRVFGSVRKQADADRLQREFGNGFVPLMMDITDADTVHQAAQKVGSMIGDRNLVGLVNNAGIVVSGPLLYLRISEYRRQLEVNMISPLVVVQGFAPLLGTDKKRQGPTGRIVNITSSGAKVAIPLLGAYLFLLQFSRGSTTSHSHLIQSPSKRQSRRLKAWITKSRSKRCSQPLAGVRTSFP